MSTTVCYSTVTEKTDTIIPTGSHYNTNVFQVIFFHMTPALFSAQDGQFLLNEQPFHLLFSLHCSVAPSYIYCTVPKPSSEEKIMDSLMSFSKHPLLLHLSV